MTLYYGEGGIIWCIFEIDFFCRRHYKTKFDIDPGYIF